ncbi:hypothetical protein FJT64_005426 [Amphibalanus amphitrite]|uniref:Uncharacterized protein n=1 Tax=Amphibalanus amphitrite TaxID=1232801 RepID=A0A6A4VLB0_AMPAM|nr:hypothetical protein FJT64_005426 [Amphibalanus amphitrite]
MVVWPALAGYAGWHLAPLLAPSRLKLLSTALVASGFLLTLVIINSYQLANKNTLLLSLKGTTTTTTTTTTASTVDKRTALCFADQFNGAQANPYLVLTQTDGEAVVVRGVGVGALVTGAAALPLLLKQGGDVSCSLATVETLAADGAFDLSQTVYSVTVPTSYSIGGTGTDIVGMNLALDSLPNGCCTITRIA